MNRKILRKRSFAKNYIQKEEKRKKNDPFSKRVSFLIALMVVFSVLIVIRLFDVQILKTNYYSALASGQHQIYEDLVPHRGMIYVEDRATQELFPLSVNKKMFLIYAVPKQIEDAKKASEELYGLLEIEKEDLYLKLSKENDLYEPLKGKISEERKNEILDKKIKGIQAQPEEVRFYPENQFASHLLGFFGFDGDAKVGRYGVEGYYQEKLSGEKGFLAAEKDALGRFVVGGEKLFREAKDGSDVVLTIDRVIQYKVEKILKESVEKFKAEKGTVLIMNPQNGEIIAMANFPDFNPNEYSKVEDVNVFSNDAIYELYEPGSSFKPIIMASAINIGLVSPSTEYEDTGSVKVDEYTIKNSDLMAHGRVTMTQVLEKSSNLGMVYVSGMMGKQRMYQYLERFGFLELSGIDLDFEGATRIQEPKYWSEMDRASIAFGQGIAITPLRLVNGTAAIANGGSLVKPHVVKKIINSDGSEENVDDKFKKEVISRSTADTVSAMMVSVVEHGYGKRAKVEGYRIAGKTGTAQVANKNGKGYDPNQKITTFVGFAPTENPQFVMLVKFNNPEGDVWGEDTAAPVFKIIAEELFKYYQIPPVK